MHSTGLLYNNNRTHQRQGCFGLINYSCCAFSSWPCFLERQTFTWQWKIKESKTIEKKRDLKTGRGFKTREVFCSSPTNSYKMVGHRCIALSVYLQKFGLVCQTLRINKFSDKQVLQSVKACKTVSLICSN